MGNPAGPGDDKGGTALFRCRCLMASVLTQSELLVYFLNFA